MKHDLLFLIWRSTLVASVAICFVLALRLPIRRWLGAQAAYLLWSLVPCALLAAMLPAPAHPLAAVLQVVPAAFTIAATAAPNAMPAAPALDRQAWLLAIWCIGVIAVLASLVWQQRRYLRALGGLVAGSDGALRAQGRNGSPALVGALRPRIVLPHDFDSRFDARERELVLAHERAHLARGDAQINALIALLRCLNWFNPLFHFAASRLRFDQELACDAHVIHRFPEARRPYADAMLKAQLIGEARQELRLPIGCYWPSTHPLKERIAMLKLPILSPRRRVLASACVALLALSVGYASWASQPGSMSTNPVATGSSATDGQRIGARFVLAIDGEQVVDTLDDDLTRRYAPGGWQIEITSDEADMSGAMKHKSTTPVVYSGHPITIAATRGAERWLLAGVPTSKGDGTYVLAATVEHNGIVVSQPTLSIVGGQTAAVQLGAADATGQFKGMRLDVTLSEFAKNNGKLAAITADDDTAPSENAAFRKMRPPRYPAEAVKSRIQGKVILKVQMNAEGVPLGSEVVSIEPKEAGVLADAAISAAMQWRYTPGTKNGKAVGGYIMVPVDFALDDEETHESLPPPAPQSAVAASYRRMRPPQYPATALAGNVTGTVWVRAHLNGEGAVTEAHAEQTYPLAASDLADAAVGAIKAWTFNPATVNDVPVDGDVIVPLHFAIDGYTPQANSEPVPVFPPQTPLLAMVTITGPRSCTKDCDPPPPPPPSPPLPTAPLPNPPLPPQPVNTTSVTPTPFDIFPAEEHC